MIYGSACWCTPTSVLSSCKDKTVALFDVTFFNLLCSFIVCSRVLLLVFFLSLGSDHYLLVCLILSEKSCRFSLCLCVPAPCFQVQFPSLWQLAPVAGRTLWSTAAATFHQGRIWCHSIMIGRHWSCFIAAMHALKLSCFHGTLQRSIAPAFGQHQQQFGRTAETSYIFAGVDEGFCLVRWSHSPRTNKQTSVGAWS